MPHLHLDDVRYCTDNNALCHVALPQTSQHATVIVSHKLKVHSLKEGGERLKEEALCKMPNNVKKTTEITPAAVTAAAAAVSTTTEAAVAAVAAAEANLSYLGYQSSVESCFCHNAFTLIIYNSQHAIYRIVM